MFKSRLLKNIVVCIMFVFIFSGSSMMSYADEVREKEPNDTMETAELIMANHDSAAQAVSGKHEDENVVYGDTSKTDTDWYKVYLTAGTQYVICNGDSYRFDVYDPNGIFITGKVYKKAPLGSTATPFTETTDGMYYVKITGIMSSSTSYILLVGDPVYTVASCKVNLTTVTMANNRNGLSTFNISTENVLPDGAIVYMMAVRNVRNLDVTNISVRNLSSNNTVNLDKYSWNKSGLVNLNMPLKSNWSITYEYKKDVSFTPSIELYYAYPVVSTYVQDDIEITP